jgi:hypothetical protein
LVLGVAAGAAAGIVDQDAQDHYARINAAKSSYG